MLERTAAGLESSNLSLRRAIPRSTSTNRHPAAQTVLSSRPSFSRASSSATRQNVSRAAQQGSADSSLLLDFLYPRQTHALLQQQLPSNLRHRHTVKIPSSTNGCRYFSSQAGPRESEPRSQATEHAVTTEATEANDAHTLGPGKDTRADGITDSKNITNRSNNKSYETQAVSESDFFDEDADRSAEKNPASEQSHGRSGRATTIEELLADPEGQLYHDVWDLYGRADQRKKEALRPAVLHYLSKSQSVVEAGRAMSLFRQTPLEQWNNEFMSAAVLVMLRSDDRTQALDTFKKGLEAKDLTGGLEYLILDSVNKQHWDTTLDAWLAYCKHVAARDLVWKADETLLDPLKSLPSLGALYFSLERYLAADGMRVERWLDLDLTTKEGLRIFRRRFAVEALRQPCPPKQASIILSFWNDHWMYERYLWRMFDRWYTKKIPTSMARALPAIYKDWKTLPGAKPSTDTLRGIFKVHYPHGVGALNELHDDWIQSWGELSQWGFEKFLKFYAHRGDVKRVRKLWDRFVKLYPEKVTTPRGFRSTMNVYAQAADVSGAEGELDRMINEYKVEPDLDIWNTLLKCYVRADDYSKTLACFDDIANNMQPDSFTYAHVMAMCSKKGDLDRTVEYFNMAQESRVPVTKEMALALVVACCRNEQLIEAENLCVELANRGVTSTAIWNQLLHYNAMHGRLNRCYELLNSMKKYNLEWNDETIGSLLMALVRVNQVSAAFQIIRDGLKNNLIMLKPEHFATVMLGAMRTGDRPTAEALVTLMEKHKFPVPFNALVAYTQASLNAAPNTLRTPALGKEIVTSLRSILGDPTGDVRQLRRQTSNMGKGIQVLVQLRDFGSAEELMNLFMDLFPQYREGDVVPQDVLASLMLAYHRDGNYNRVIELWNEAWPKILKRCSINSEDESEEKGIYPAHQFDVTRLVFRLAETYRAMQDGDGLLQCVESVVNAGFKLTSMTWDRVIRGLAENGRWERGMDWCETLLMPNWRGWNPTKKTLNERREALNPRALEATSHAILALQKPWLEERRLSIWSAATARKLESFEERYPELLYAFSTSDYRDIPGPWIFRGDVELVKALSELLVPLSLNDLRDMEKELEKALATLQNEGEIVNSPFRLFAGNSEETRAMEKRELDLLRSTLKTRLLDREEQAVQEARMKADEREEEWGQKRREELGIKAPQRKVPDLWSSE